MNGKKCRRLREMCYHDYDPTARWADIRSNEKSAREMINVRYDKPPDYADRKMISRTLVNPKKNCSRTAYQRAKARAFGLRLL